MTSGLAVFPLLTAAVIACPAAAGSTHCSPSEQTVFSCAIGAKIVSLCASADLSSAAGAIQYRFGPVDRPEIAYPPAGSWRDLVRSGRWIFAGGGGAWLAFHKPPFRYIVYTAIGRGWGQKAGIAVEENGRRLTNLPCTGTPVSELGPDFFARAGIPDDATPFDLP